MKVAKWGFKVFIMLVMLCLLLPFGADIDVYAQGTTTTWTAATASKETTITGMMKGDYGVNINKYNPFDWRTWMTGLN